MGKIAKIHLYSKIPLMPEQEAVCLADIQVQARQGFRIELQREVFAHTAEETFVFNVAKIEPTNKFYGLVDGDTEFEIIHDELKKPPLPSIEKCGYSLEDMKKASEELLSQWNEANKVKGFIDDLEAVRDKHNVSWSCLLKVVEAIDKFGNETAPRL